MMPKPTPAPWKPARIHTNKINIVPHPTRGFSGHVVDAEGNIVAHVFGRSESEAEANAKLIATAPEMLAELDVRAGDLVMLHGAIEAGDPRNELLVRVKDMLRETRAALSKAGA